MTCPHCASATTNEQTQKTTLGYRTFRCSTCKHRFNERTGTPFNCLEYPTDVVLLVVLWRLRYKLSLRDLAEMFLERGITFTYEAVREWEGRFAPLIAEQLRIKRRGQAGRSWYVDETYVRVKGNGAISIAPLMLMGTWLIHVEVERRDMEAAQRFFKQALAVVGHTPEQVITDGHASYPRAVRETLGDDVQHQTNKYLNNRVEQDHRGIKQRYYLMHGFGNVDSAARFCCAFDELRNYLHPRNTTAESTSHSEQRRAFLDRLGALKSSIQAIF